jgi:hypothetical protein
MGIPLNHPFIAGFFPYKPSILGTPIDGNPHMNPIDNMLVYVNHFHMGWVKIVTFPTTHYVTVPNISMMLLIMCPKTQLSRFVSIDPCQSAHPNHP